MFMDVAIEDAELLDDPRGDWDEEFADHRPFLRGRRLELSTPLLVAVAEPGRPLDIAMTAHGNWYVTPPIGQILEEYAGPERVQRLPCRVADGRSLEILNVLDFVDCLDLGRSRGILYFDEREGPGGVNRNEAIKYIRQIAIDRSRAAGHHIFRIKGYSQPLIVSQRVRSAIEACGARGAMFMEVMPPYPAGEEAC
jgi:hypothetical protein